MNRLVVAVVAPVVAAIGWIGVARTAAANPTIEIGGTAGVHVFSDTNGIGVPQVPNADSERNSALFGLRFGAFFTPMVGLEAEGGIIPSEGRQQVYDVWNLAYRLQVVGQYAKTGDEKIIPFIFVGAGAMSVVSSQGQGDPTKIQKDTITEAYAGIGVKYRVDNGFGLRADARIMFPPSSASNSFTEDYEVLLSIYREWGRKKKEPVAAKPKDSDGDGIIDDLDKCPNEPEDKDGYQDDDGCPDPDNDGDGIPDALDKCPNDAEDFDGFQDADGCPDPDNDKDGIPDAQDKCPNDAAGKYGSDGCPNPDHDGDGVPDVSDKCPDTPGPVENNGCPLPEKLKKFSGSIKGINFRVGSVEILSSSNKVLDEAISVLKEFKDINVEIQGHTDDIPFTPRQGRTGPQSNEELSQGRADAVKAYMVKNGIEDRRLTAKGYGDTMPVDDPKGLTGQKLQDARTKNRRVEFKLTSTAP